MTSNSESMTFEKQIRIHQVSFRSAYDFLNEHFPPGPDLEWWEQTAKDASAASVKCGENKLAILLIAAVCDYLESEYKRRGNNGETSN